jgi:peptide-methionine (S)-S-oxide reductase
MNNHTATFAAGCFWGVEAAFRAIDGVTRTTVGYTGGDVDRPTYEQVCRGRTGHAEAVQVEYDPQRVSYDQLLATFWDSHNPTTRNRQGWDYQRGLDREIVTEIVPVASFWPAEDYHQQYLEKRGQSSCAVTLDAA